MNQLGFKSHAQAQYRMKKTNINNRIETMREMKRKFLLCMKKIRAKNNRLFVRPPIC